MKRLALGLCCAFALPATHAYAQKTETFDGVTYTIPKGWTKKPGNAVVHLSVTSAKGSSAIMLFKSLPGEADSKANFASSWDLIVKEALTPSGKPQMQPTSQEDGWTIEHGFAPYDADGKKGLAVLLTGTGNKKVVNVLILTDTEAYEPDITAFLKALRLPKLVAKATQPVAPVKPAPAPTPGKFQFTTTNFDDGWTAVEQQSWVKATKGGVTALIHYPNQKADAYNSVLKAGLQNAWNILVAPRYATIQNLEWKPIQSFESIAFAEADATEKATGKPVHIVLFKKHFSKGNGRYIEIVTDSKSAFEQAFGAYHNDEFGWDSLVNLQAKNRFGVAASDLVGKWGTSDYAALQYYYVKGGGFAGATATATADLFSFARGGTYQSDHSGASGVVGSQKFSRQVYNGKYSTATWNLTLTNRFKGASEKYDCYFEAVKGGRILVLTDRNNTVLSLGKR